MDVLYLFNHCPIDSKEVSKTHMDKKNINQGHIL